MGGDEPRGSGAWQGCSLSVACAEPSSGGAQRPGYSARSACSTHSRYTAWRPYADQLPAPPSCRRTAATRRNPPHTHTGHSRLYYYQPGDALLLLRDILHAGHGVQVEPGALSLDKPAPGLCLAGYYSGRDTPFPLCASRVLDRQGARGVFIAGCVGAQEMTAAACEASGTAWGVCE